MMTFLEHMYGIDDTRIQKDWIGEWWIMSPDDEHEVCVAGVGGTYAEALQGIQEAHKARVDEDNPDPLWEWRLECDRPCDHENFMNWLRSKCNDVA